MFAGAVQEMDKTEPIIPDVFYFFRLKTKGMDKKASPAQILNVDSKPILSPKIPVRSTMRELMPKLMVM